MQTVFSKLYFHQTVFLKVYPAYESSKLCELIYMIYIKTETCLPANVYVVLSASFLVEHCQRFPREDEFLIFALGWECIEKYCPWGSISQYTP